MKEDARTSSRRNDLVLETIEKSPKIRTKIIAPARCSRYIAKIKRLERVMNLSLGIFKTFSKINTKENMMSSADVGVKFKRFEKE